MSLYLLYLMPNIVKLGFFFKGLVSLHTFTVFDPKNSLEFLHHELSRPRGCPFGGPTPAGSIRGEGILGFVYLEHYLPVEQILPFLRLNCLVTR